MIFDITVNNLITINHELTFSIDTDSYETAIQLAEEMYVEETDNQFGWVDYASFHFNDN